MSDSRILQQKTRELKPQLSNRTLRKFIRDNWQLFFVLAYVLFPFDFLPEGILPGFGFADDAVLVMLELARRVWVYRKRGIPSSEAQKFRRAQLK